MVTLPTEQPTVFLATKLVAPHLPATLVARERLVALMRTTLAHRVTLVSAPAGSGKTTLLSAWLSQYDHSGAWLSLDEVDNDPVRFWTALVTALRTRLPEVGALPLAMLRSPESPPLTPVVTTLLNELASHPEPAPLVIIVDDYHLITDPAIHESLAFFVEHLPTHVHLVLATRVDPDLPLARWRADGVLLELRAADLRFTVIEASHFFTRTLGTTLEDDAVRRLVQRTEGWAAGLHLAALALRQRTDRAAFVDTFTGTHRFVVDYVLTEVVDRQEPHLQRFLLHVAVLRRMTAALCIAVTKDGNSQGVLEFLERSNLFVVPLDDERRWYRMHDLFREVLLARLQATEPEVIPRLHRRAAHWYVSQGEMREAITHAFAAQDFDDAVEMVEREAPQLWQRGDVQTVHNWVRALPDSVVLRHAPLALDAALRLIESVQSMVTETYRQAQTEVEQTIERVENMLSMMPNAERVVLRRRIGLLQAVVALRAALMSADTAGIRRLAEHSTALAEGEEGRWKRIALWITCLQTETMQREGALLLPQLLVAKQEVSEAGNQVEVIRTMQWMAFAFVRAGRFRDAVTESRVALALAEQIGQQSAATGYFYMFLAWAYRALNQLDNAANSVQHLLRHAQTWQQADQLIVGNMAWVSCALARRDYPGARQALLQAEALVEQEGLALHASAVHEKWVEYWLATGNLEAACAWAEQVVIVPETWHPNQKWECLLFVRVCLAQEQYARAATTLDQFSAHLDRAGDISTTMEFLALQVAALQGVGQPGRAQAILARLLALTVGEGGVRVFLDAGELMRRALQQLHNHGRDQDNDRAATISRFVSQILAVFAREEAKTAGTPATWTTLERTPPLVEPLTLREQQVLRLLVTGASNAEIAAELVISLATVKKHVSNVLGKLGVATRAQAIARVAARPDLI